MNWTILKAGQIVSGVMLGLSLMWCPFPVQSPSAPLFAAIGLIGLILASGFLANADAIGKEHEKDRQAAAWRKDHLS